MNECKENFYNNPFGNLNASDLSDDQIRFSFIETPEVEPPLFRGSRAYAARQRCGKTHTLKRNYLNFVNSAMAPEAPLREWERLDFTDEHFIIGDNNKVLAKYLYDAWITVFTYRAAGMLYNAIKEGCSDFTTDKTKNSCLSLAACADIAGVDIKYCGSCMDLYYEIINRDIIQQDNNKKFYLPFRNGKFIEMLKSINLNSYLFLDLMEGSDVKYDQAPKFWDINLASLYKAVIYLKKKIPQFHIFFTIRREVLFSYFFENYDDDSITSLNPDNIIDIVWTKKVLKKFWEEKIKLLPGNFYPYFRASDSPIHRFLGIKKLKKNKEDIFDYIIRHTFYRPWDLIFIGNEIWRRIKDLNLKYDRKSYDRGKLEIAIRSVVNEKAKFLASEAIRHCDVLIKEEISRKSLHRTKSPTRSLLRRLKMDMLSYDELLDIKNAFNRRYGLIKLNSRLFNPLYKSCLIGWAQENTTQKFIHEDKAYETYPVDLHRKYFYFVHPTVAHLRQFSDSKGFSSGVIIGHDRKSPEKFVYVPSDSDDHGKYIFRRLNNDYWEIVFLDIRLIWLKAKGFNHIHYLVERAGKQIPVYDFDKEGQITDLPGPFEHPKPDEWNNNIAFKNKGDRGKYKKMKKNGEIILEKEIEKIESELKELINDRAQVDEYPNPENTMMLKEFEEKREKLEERYKELTEIKTIHSKPDNEENIDKRRTKNRIAKSIERALNVIKENDKTPNQKVFNHFDKALKPINSPSLSYKPFPQINWITY